MLGSKNTQITCLGGYEYPAFLCWGPQISILQPPSPPPLPSKVIIIVLPDNSSSLTVGPNPKIRRLDYCSRQAKLLMRFNGELSFRQSRRSDTAYSQPSFLSSPPTHVYPALSTCLLSISHGSILRLSPSLLPTPAGDQKPSGSSYIWHRDEEMRA